MKTIKNVDSNMDFHSEVKQNLNENHFDFDFEYVKGHLDCTHLEGLSLSIIKNHVFEDVHFKLNEVNPGNVISFFLKGSFGLDINKKNFLSGGEEDVISILSNHNIDVEGFVKKNTQFHAISFEFSDSRFEKLNMWELNNTSIYTALKNLKIRNILDEILNCKYVGNIKNLYLESKIIESMVLACDLMQNGKKSTQSLKKIDSEIIKNAKDYINNNFCKKLSLSGIANAINSNTNKLKSDFKLAYGISVFDYIKEKRLNYAKELLESGQLDVGQACYFVGYKSHSSFSKSFKKAFNYSPKIFKS